MGLLRGNDAQEGLLVAGLATLLERGARCAVRTGEHIGAALELRAWVARGDLTQLQRQVVVQEGAEIVHICNLDFDCHRNLNCRKGLWHE